MPDTYEAARLAYQANYNDQFARYEQHYARLLAEVERLQREEGLSLSEACKRASDTATLLLHD